MATSPFNNLDGQKYHPEESHYHRSHDSKHAELEFPLALTANTLLNRESTAQHNLYLHTITLQPPLKPTEISK